MAATSASSAARSTSPPRRKASVSAKRSTRGKPSRSTGSSARAGVHNSEASAIATTSTVLHAPKKRVVTASRDGVLLASCESTHERLTRSAPLPLWGEGWGGGATNLELAPLTP